MSDAVPAFARDPATAAYYDRRAGEYDEWYRNEGQYAARRRDGWTEAVADPLCLPVAAGSVDRVFTGHFYGHLPPPERRRFLAEVRRVAAELVVVDSARRPDVPAEGWQWRVLNDGSRHRVYKRYLTGPQLAEELGGQVLLDGSWFVAVRARRRAEADAAQGL